MESMVLWIFVLAVLAIVWYYKAGGKEYLDELEDELEDKDV